MQPMTEVIAELRALPTSELVRRYGEVYGKAPRVNHREWLWKRIAWRIQEQRTGGLSEVAKQRLEELIAQIDIPLHETTRTVTGKLRAEAAPPVDSNRDGLHVGSSLVRDWKGQRIVLRVVDGGYEHAGVTYGSLSAAAQAITHSKWNGKLFFGLTKRGGS